MVHHSIILPTAGRPNEIKSAIQSLLKLTNGQNHVEIIIVDNNSIQELSDNLKDHCLLLGERVRYVKEPSPGLSAARHRGVVEAKSNLLTFLDDDVVVSKKWLSTIQRAFENPDTMIVGGPSIPRFTSSVPEWFWDFVRPTPYGGWMCGWLSLLDIGYDVINIDPNFIWGLNFSIRKNVLEACGGFHPDMVPVQLQRWQGDGETGLTMKVKVAGYRADYLHNAMLFHNCGHDRLNIAYFKKRAFYQGVCDSFTQIRSIHTSSEISLKFNLNSHKKICRQLRIVWQWLKEKIVSNSWAKKASEVKAVTQQAYRDGWNFHQNEVAADPALLAWVMKENYFTADIREESNENRHNHN